MRPTMFQYISLSKYNEKSLCLGYFISGNIQMPSHRNNLTFQNNFGKMKGYRFTDIVKPVNNKKQIL